MFRVTEWAPVHCRPKTTPLHSTLRRAATVRCPDQPKAIDTQTRQRLLQIWRKLYPYANPAAESCEFGGQKFSLGSLAGLPGFLSEEDAASYNAVLDRVFGGYEAFLTFWPDAVNAYRRIIPFRLMLEN